MATETQSGIGAFWDIRVECFGNEKRIDDCVLDRSSNLTCSHMSPVEDIYLTCEPVTDGVLRLERGNSQFVGRLEVWYDGEWGTVCEDEWRNFPQNAQVACRQLGYSGGDHRRVNKMVNLAVKFWIDDLQCQNNERRLSDCMFKGWGNENCFHALFDDVFLTCKPYRDGSIRMIGGSNKYEGRLEVYVSGEWGGICINKWDGNVLNAHVACRQLSFTGGTFRHLNISERGMETFWMDNIECRGDEVNLGECFFNGWGVHNCAHSSNGVFLTCNPNKGDIRLLGGANEYEGRVSIFLDGRWNFICGGNWNNTNAAITCQQLGLNGGIATSVQKNTTDYILDVDLYCRRNPKELVTCPTITSSCSSNTVAFALCYAPGKSIKTSLQT
ncbi:neurotrypsin-like [Mizuhopecten yessoensis]|uniref:neurotrypsin-like n=1 Tax=Mizuhopecten yessoensis TaxID=6573 RepID=UPI000B45E4F2|nr:neurotrypsin-like [Mizuhopecten yessoensis]